MSDLSGYILRNYGMGSIDDFRLTAELFDMGYEIENKVLVNTPVESTYEMRVRRCNELKAKLIISSEMGVGTMLKDIN